jgi:hypothetical protein
MNVDNLWDDSEGKTEVRGDKRLSQCCFVQNKSHVEWTWIDSKYSNNKQQKKKHGKYIRT